MLQIYVYLKQVLDVKRNDETLSHVTIEFRVLASDTIQPPNDVLAILSRLSVAETSAYLGYPVSHVYSRYIHTLVL